MLHVKHNFWNVGVDNLTKCGRGNLETEPPQVDDESHFLPSTFYTSLQFTRSTTEMKADPFCVVSTPFTKGTARSEAT